MTVPEVMLDDRRFQDLVKECRTRVARNCPDWTETNVSDPGITLIELFAWMTDMLSYRINRLPEKAHMALLGLLDVHLDPPRAATAELRLLLERPPSNAIRIPARVTEAATRRAPTQESVVFQTTEDFIINPLSLQACLLLGADRFVEVSVNAGGARPTGAERFAFSQPPQLGDCVLLGFRRALDRLVVRVEVECEPARGVGIDPGDPPLAWEASGPNEEWLPVNTLSDTTKGFNKEKGAIELELPPRTATHPIGAHRLYWLRCKLDPAVSDNALRTIYSGSPEIFSLSAAPVGATIPAEHCERVGRESLGRSDGTPGQTFKLHCSPVLPLVEGERLETYDERAKRWVGWERVETFADSARHALHYMLDEAAGEVELGPVVRQPEGGFCHYGEVPAAGSELRFSAYRHGGGMAGNVAANTITHLRRPIAGVRSVTNPQPATGGMEGESIENARTRMATELRTRRRAITGRDFEDLCVASTGRVARAHCEATANGGCVRVRIVPHVERPNRGMSAAELEPKPDLLREVTNYLEERRLVGTNVILEPARYRAVSVVTRVRADPSADASALRRSILGALYRSLNPLIGGSASGDGEGWQFGRRLKRGELYPIVEGIDGVAQIVFVRVYETQLAGGRLSPEPLSGDLELDVDELIASGAHRVRIESPSPV